MLRKLIETKFRLLKMPLTDQYGSIGGESDKSFMKIRLQVFFDALEASSVNRTASELSDRLFMCLCGVSFVF